jgi:hypothetical protein
MFGLASCSRGVARLVPRAPAALRASVQQRGVARRALAAVAGTDTRFRIPPASVPDHEILTIDDEEIEQRRDNTVSTRLVQARILPCSLAAPQPAAVRQRRAHGTAVRASRRAAPPPAAFAQQPRRTFRVGLTSAPRVLLCSGTPAISRARRSS